MTKNLFSVPIFFIAFRETLEAAIIVSVLLGLAEQIVYEDPGRFTQEHTVTSTTDESKQDNPEQDLAVAADEEVQRRRLIRKLRIQVRSRLHQVYDDLCVYLSLRGRFSQVQV